MNPAQDFQKLYFAHKNTLIFNFSTKEIVMVFHGVGRPLRAKRLKDNKEYFFSMREYRVFFFFCSRSLPAPAQLWTYVPPNIRGVGPLVFRSCSLS